MKLNLSTLIGGLLVCSLMVSCADLQKAKLAFQEGNYTLAQAHWQDLAEHGFPEAWLGLGKIAELSLDGQNKLALKYYQHAYDLGYDRAAYRIGQYYYKYHKNQEDLKFARYWILKAAKQGSPGAYFIYADMQMYGLGEAENIQSALSIFRALAEYGYALASRRLAYLYEKGFNVEQNKVKALDYFRQALSQGSIESELDIGRFYTYGYAVKTDFDKAESIFMRFVELENPQAAYLLGDLYQRKFIIEGKPLLEKSVEWFKFSAERGYVPAKIRMIDLMLESNYDNLEIAVEKLKKLSRLNEGKASYRLGRLISTGRVADNKKAELEYYQLAYEQGYELAAYRIAEYYFKNQKNPQDLQKAQQWQQKALQQKSDDARFILAELTLKGNGWLQNSTKAIELYQVLSDKGKSSASRELAKIYEHGLYTNQNFRQALSFYERAANQGNVNAELDIARFYADGLGVDSNWLMAKNIFLKYAQAGYHKAAYLLAKNLEQRALMASQEIPEQAVYWYQMAAKQNNLSAKLKLIDMMLEGQGVTRNIDKAKAELGLLSTAGVAEASFRLAELNANKENKDIAQALNYYQLAFQQGSKKSIAKLVELYQQGHGLNNNAVRIAYIHSVDAGNIDAAYLLGVLEAALSESKNALHWYQKAAQGGHAVAMLQYGLALFWGHHIKTNKIQGLAYVLSAARLHVSGAVTKSLNLMVALNNVEKIELANHRSKNIR